MNQFQELSLQFKCFLFKVIYKKKTKLESEKKERELQFIYYKIKTYNVQK